MPKLPKMPELPKLEKFNELCDEYGPDEFMEELALVMNNSSMDKLTELFLEFPAQGRIIALAIIISIINADADRRGHTPVSFRKLALATEMADCGTSLDFIYGGTVHNDILA